MIGQKELLPKRDEFLKKINEDVIQTRKIFADGTSFEEQVENFRQFIMNQKLVSYCRSEARITSLLTSGCGNCDARARYTATILQDAHIALPEGMDWGIQNFSDHVQPVLYNKKTGAVYDLIGGDEKQTVVAPIYRFESYFAQFLDSRHEKVDYSKYLIKDVDFSCSKNRLKCT